MKGRKITEINVGESDYAVRTISESDIYLYGGLIGDCSPWHYDAEYCKQSPFKTRIAYGMLVGGLFASVIGRTLPGPNALYLHQDLDFKAPVLMGDTVRAECEVIEINTDKSIMKLRTTVTKQDGTLAIEGKAIIKVV